MNLSSEGLDEATADVVRALEFQSDDEVLQWWQIMREAYEAANADVEDLLTRVRAAARDASFDERRLEAFALAVSTGGIDLVQRMIALEPWIPAYYWTLQDYSGGTQQGEATNEWDWVTEAQVQVVRGYWGDRWVDFLGPWLEQRWGVGWEQHPAEHRTAWLDALLQEFSASAQSSEGPFTWVSASQAAALTSIWGEDWYNPVRQHLDSRWGAGWEDNPDDHKVAWLDSLLTEWTAGALSDEPSPTSVTSAEAPRAMAPTESPATEPRSGELSYDQVMEQAFAAALKKVPGASELPENEIARARAAFAAEFDRTYPRPAAQGDIS